MSTAGIVMRSFRNDFLQHVRVRGDSIAVIDGVHEFEFSYAAVAEVIARFGAFFKAHRLKEGDVIASVIPNSVEALFLFFAAAQHGLTYAPITHEARPSELARWVTTVRPALVVFADTISETCKSSVLASKIPTVIIGLDCSFQWLPDSKVWSSLSGAVGGRLLITTSGSTGDPKALVMDVDTLWSSGCAFVGQHPFVDHSARFFNILPMSYLGGLFNLGLIPLAAGGSLVVVEPFSGRAFLDFWQNVERFEINVLWLVPTILRGLLSLAERTHRNTLSLASKLVRACFLGTAPIDLASKQRFESVFGIPVLENFALSETTFFSSETLATRSRRVEGSVGEVLPYATVAFKPVMIDEGENQLGKTQPTEIFVRTPYLFRGYLQPDGTIERSLDQDGFFATSDLGQLDNEGRLIIEGRNRDIIKKAGYFVSLQEIEKLALSNGKVEEAAAIKISHAFYGEDFVLFLRFKHGSQGDSAEFGQWLRQNLVKYKWPERILAVDDFPRTASGKISKHLIRI